MAGAGGRDIDHKGHKVTKGAKGKCGCNVAVCGQGSMVGAGKGGWMVAIGRFATKAQKYFYNHRYTEGTELPNWIHHRSSYSCADFAG